MVVPTHHPVFSHGRMILHGDSCRCVDVSICKVNNGKMLRDLGTRESRSPGSKPASIPDDLALQMFSSFHKPTPPDMPDMPQVFGHYWRLTSQRHRSRARRTRRLGGIETGMDSGQDPTGTVRRSLLARALAALTGPAHPPSRAVCCTVRVKTYSTAFVHVLPILGMRFLTDSLKFRVSNLESL